MKAAGDVVDVQHQAVVLLQGKWKISDMDNHTKFHSEG